MKLSRLRKIEVTYNKVSFMKLEQQQNNSFGLCYFKKFKQTNFVLLKCFIFCGKLATGY